MSTQGLTALEKPANHDWLFPDFYISNEEMTFSHAKKFCADHGMIQAVAFDQDELEQGLIQPIQNLWRDRHGAAAWLGLKRGTLRAPDGRIIEYPLDFRFENEKGLYIIPYEQNVYLNYWHPNQPDNLNAEGKREPCLRLAKWSWDGDVLLNDTECEILAFALCVKWI